MTVINRRAVYDKYDGHCAYCGKEITFKEMQVDHIVSKFLYNKYHKINKYEFELNAFENLNPSCRKCNYYKHAEGVEAFRKHIKTLHKRFTKIFIVQLAIRFGIIEVKPWDGKFYFEKYKTNKNLNHEKIGIVRTKRSNSRS